MVEFCRTCGGSLARGDLTFWMGEIFTSPDYLCPFCGRHANPDAPKVEPAAPEAPDAGSDLVFKEGRSDVKPAPPETP
jgi:hypothetical protein